MRILAIKAVKTKLGKPNVLISTAEKDHWVAYGMWTSHGNSENLEAYVGGEFTGDYFKKGETLLNGNVAENDDVILRDFSASMNPAVLAGAIAMENREKAQSLTDAALLFRRKRIEAQAAAAAAVPATAEAQTDLANA